MSAVETLVNLSGAITGLVSTSNASLAKELHTWVTQGGLESLKTDILTFLDCKASAHSADCTISGKINLPINMQFGDAQRIDVESKTTVRDVKTILESITGVPVTDQQLTYSDGKELADDQNILTAYYLGGRSNIITMALVQHSIPIYMSSASGTYINVTIDTTVGNAHELIEVATGVPVSRQTLTLNGTILTDDQFIYDTWLSSGKAAIYLTQQS